MFSSNTSPNACLRACNLLLQYSSYLLLTRTFIEQHLVSENYNFETKIPRKKIPLEFFEHSMTFSDFQEYLESGHPVLLCTMTIDNNYAPQQEYFKPEINKWNSRKLSYCKR